MYIYTYTLCFLLFFFLNFIWMCLSFPFVYKFLAFKYKDINTYNVITYQISYNFIRVICNHIL